MKQVIILKGLQGSGKSTWAREQLATYPGRSKRISKDDLRAMLDDGKWSQANEQFILQVRDTLVLAALDAGYHVLVDDTNLHEKHEQAIRKLVKGRADVVIQDFTDVPLEVCIERDLRRPNSVGERVIRETYQHFLAKPTAAPAHDSGLPDALICDLDGTLALINGRNPYDTSRCEQDLLNAPIAGIISAYAEKNTTIIFTSGRSARYREQTERWLDTHGFNAVRGTFKLLMRPDGDNRKDAVVKRELYEQFIQGQYNVLFVLDDRNQMVELWRGLGLTCLQVADGAY